MNITELIAALEALRDEHGDLEVKVWTRRCGHEGHDPLQPPAVQPFYPGWASMDQGPDAWKAEGMPVVSFPWHPKEDE